MKFINSFVNDFGFASSHAVLDSLFPSSRHGLSPVVFGMGLLSAVCSSLFGMEGLLTLAFVNALLLEFVSGIVASKVSNVPMKSRRMFRFLFKLFIVLNVLFILWQFCEAYKSKNALVYQLFLGLHTLVIVVQALEYLVSILENLQVITGKSTSRISGAINKALNRLLNGQTPNQS